MSKQAGGQVKSIDAKNNALTLSDGKQLTLDQTSSITRDGKTASLSDIKEGDEVRASFSPGGATVQQLTATSASGAKKQRMH